MDRVTELIAKLHNRDSYVRWQAAAELGKDAQAVPMLIQALKDTNDVVRTSAAYALGMSQDSQAVPALISALKDKKGPVRLYASKALMEIGSPAVPALIAALKDTSATMRLFAAVALGDIASRDPTPALRDAVPTLRRLRIRDLWSATDMQMTIDKIEAATASMKDLPLPSAAPLPDVTSLPRLSTAPITLLDDLPIPSAADNVADLRSKPNDAVVRSGREWLNRWLKREERQ